MTIHHVGIAVSDRAAAERAFYAPVLGALGFERQAGEGPVAVWRHPQSGVAVHLLQGAVPVHAPDDPRAPVDHTAFRAPDRAAVDRIHADLQARGAQVLGEPRAIPQFGPTYYALFVRDPDGRLVEIVHD